MNNNVCKRCGSDHYIMNGRVRSQQRYKCKSCGCNFIFGDKTDFRYENRLNTHII